MPKKSYDSIEGAYIVSSKNCAPELSNVAAEDVDTDVSDEETICLELIKVKNEETVMLVLYEDLSAKLSKAAVFLYLGIVMVGKQLSLSTW